MTETKRPTATDRQAAEKITSVTILKKNVLLDAADVKQIESIIAAAHAKEREAAEKMAEALDWLKTSVAGEPLCFCEPTDLTEMKNQYGAHLVNHAEYCNKARAALAAYRAAMK